MIYRGERTREISFPLGGIGSGSIGLSGNGRLIDWEIFNRPGKGRLNDFSFFAIKAEDEEKVLDARVLNSDLTSGLTGSMAYRNDKGFGNGPWIATMAGVPHFEDLEFDGQYPFAALSFQDSEFPGRVSMLAFNPFIPMNDQDSSIPAAFFEFEIENPTGVELWYTICAAISNPFEGDFHQNHYSVCDGIHRIHMSPHGISSDSTEYGDLTIATDGLDVSYQEYWYFGKWFDSLPIFWKDFTAPGPFRNRGYSERGNMRPSCLASRILVASGEKKKVRFVLSWNFPYVYNYWNPENGDLELSKKHAWKNYYATLFSDSEESASYSLKNWDRLEKETRLFHRALFSSTLPDAVLDAVSANLSILKSATCLRLEDGSFYGFEGCHKDEGSCEGSCTHVWNYAYALAFLFPKLERSMRQLHLKYSLGEYGDMPFRLQLPLGRARWEHCSCADGQFGEVIKCYREWKICGDNKWLQSHWKSIQKMVEYAYHPKNPDQWDKDKKGVLSGRQHHTLDMELFGPNAWLTGFYLAALKAASQMASAMGDIEKEAEYKTLFEQGKKWMNEHLFNGEYYIQQIDLTDKDFLLQFHLTKDNGVERDIETVYWNEDAGEIRYQIAQGCGIDQVTAGWHANLCGLGEIFDKEKERKALQSIYRYNFKRNMRKHFNPCRIFATGGEGGTVVCEWPVGVHKPVVPPPYAEEVFCGCEYQAAAHMIQEQMVKEGIELVEAVRNRYRGDNRNPWNEIECGSNYARSMASYSLLNAFCGFEFDMVKKKIGFHPAIHSTPFQCFWALQSAWGIYREEESKAVLKVLYGQLSVKELGLEEKKIKSITLGDSLSKYQCENGCVFFEKEIVLNNQHSLTIQF